MFFSSINNKVHPNPVQTTMNKKSRTRYQLRFYTDVMFTSFLDADSVV